MRKPRRKAGSSSGATASSCSRRRWISAYYPDLYLYGALKEAAVYLKDDQRLALWQGEFLRRLDGVQAQGWNQNISTVPLVALADG